MVEPADDFFHERTDHPYWNESGWFGFNIPERRFSGAVYVHQRPNRGYTWAGLILWDPSGREIYDCLWYDFSPQHLPEGTQEPLRSKVFEFSTPSGLTMRNPEPLERYEFTYKNGPCSAELVFDAFMEPHDAGLAEGWDGWGTNHYEQGGRMRGEVHLRGERYEIDCLTARDRSWGPLSPRYSSRGIFDWAVASEDHGFGVQPMGTHSIEDDPVFGTTDEVLAGWYRKDGQTAHVRSGKHTVERDPETGAPATIHLTAEDDLGRSFSAEGRCVNLLNFTSMGSEVFYHWCLTEWRFDGVTAWGEEFDCFDGLMHRRMLSTAQSAFEGEG